jgi:hypothetical protein
MIDHHPGPSCKGKQDVKIKNKKKQLTWGDPFQTNPSSQTSSSTSSDIIRIVFQNINGFGYTSENSKAENIRTFIKKI